MSVKAARRFYRVDSAHDLQFIDQGESAAAENRWTFEIAWEVANKGRIALIVMPSLYITCFSFIAISHFTCSRTISLISFLFTNISSAVGGIYTVIRSKTSSSVDELGDHYVLIGPYKEMCARQEVETFELPAGTPLAIAVQKLRDLGFKVIYIIS